MTEHGSAALQLINYSQLVTSAMYLTVSENLVGWEKGGERRWKDEEWGGRRGHTCSDDSLTLQDSTASLIPLISCTSSGEARVFSFGYLDWFANKGANMRAMHPGSAVRCNPSARLQLEWNLEKKMHWNDSAGWMSGWSWPSYGHSYKNIFLHDHGKGRSSRLYHC